MRAMAIVEWEILVKLVHFRRKRLIRMLTRSHRQIAASSLSVWATTCSRIRTIQVYTQGMAIKRKLACIWTAFSSWECTVNRVDHTRGVRIGIAGRIRCKLVLRAVCEHWHRQMESRKIQRIEQDKEHAMIQEKQAVLAAIQDKQAVFLSKRFSRMVHRLRNRDLQLSFTRWKKACCRSERVRSYAVGRVKRSYTVGQDRIL